MLFWIHYHYFSNSSIHHQMPATLLEFANSPPPPSHEFQLKRGPIKWRLRKWRLRKWRRTKSYTSKILCTYTHTPRPIYFVYQKKVYTRRLYTIDYVLSPPFCRQNYDIAFNACHLIYERIVAMKYGCRYRETRLTSAAIR